MPFGVLDFIDPDGIDLTERAVLQSERDDMFDGVASDAGNPRGTEPCADDVGGFARARGGVRARQR